MWHIVDKFDSSVDRRVVQKARPVTAAFAHRYQKTFCAQVGAVGAKVFDIENKMVRVILTTKENSHERAY
jgi:hypothetical protein